jgi:hypothetical protein
MTVFKRLRVCATGALAPAMKTGLWIIKITVPVSFGVLLLKLTGLLPIIAGVFAPLFALFGMPGESALVFVTAGLVNIYACCLPALFAGNRRLASFYLNGVALLLISQ